MSAARRLVVGAAATVVAACELPEVTVPEGDPIVVVHAVMRPDLTRQWVLVEQTLTGTLDVDSLPVTFPGELPALPVTGATVTVVNRSLPTDPCGVTLFTEDAAPIGVTQAPGLYWGPTGCPTMRTGDTLALRVETIDGAVVTGTTEAPGAAAMLLRTANDTVRMPGPATTFNRDLDTLELEALAIAGRALQLEVSRPDSGGNLVRGFWFAVDSTRMTLPGDLPDIIAAFTQDTAGFPDELPPVFAAGRRYFVTAALTDAKYWDFVRSGNIPPSGRGFINHLEGGMGVFASLVAFTNTLQIVGNVDDRREGAYRATGLVTGVLVDVGLELYVAGVDEDSTSASAFVRGEWMGGPIDTSADGFFGGDSLTLTVFQRLTDPPDSITAVRIAGPAPQGGSATLTAYDPTGAVIGTVALTGPDPLPAGGPPPRVP